MMEKRCIISGRGAQLIEAYANGLKRDDLQKLLHITLNTVKTHTARLGDKLRLPAECTDPVNRIVATAMAAGLLRPRDLKLPDSVFSFTMSPDADSLFDCRYMRDVCINPSFKMPIEGEEHMGKREITAWQRTCLSALALGMSFPDMVRAGIDARDGYNEVAALTRWKQRARSVYLQMGVQNAPQAIAHASAMGVISLNPETIPILEPDAKISPIIYTDNVVIHIDRPAYYVPPHLKVA